MNSAELSARQTQQDYKQRILRVLVHIQQHMDEQLDLNALARVACFSPYHFHRIFTGMVGESVKAHIRRLRLERAASHLKSGTLPVIDVALTAGYETHEAFTRAFKTCFGTAPSQFRSAGNLSPTLSSPSRVHWNTPIKNFRFNRTGLHTMNVEIKTVTPMRVAFLRHIGPYDQVGATWEKLCVTLGKEGYLGDGALFIGICYDDPDVTPPDKIRYDACITVNDRFTPTGDIKLQVVAGGQYAMTTHFGSYDTLNKTYAQLFGQWLPRCGRKLGPNPCFEIYLNSPENTEPDDLLTDVYLSLASDQTA